MKDGSSLDMYISEKRGGPLLRAGVSRWSGYLLKSNFCQSLSKQSEYLGYALLRV